MQKERKIFGLIAVFLMSLGLMTGLQMTAVVAADSPKTIQAAKGGGHMLQLKEDGFVWAWGSNEYGQLGNATTVDSPSAVQVGGLTGIKAIAAGGGHSLALKEDGTVWAWGSNMYGQVGDGSVINKTMPVQVQGLTGITAIAAGENHSLALKADGTVWAFGLNDKGQIGDKTLINKITPIKVHGLANIKTISSGDNHNLALKENNIVYSWGKNDFGQLGNGTLISTSVPDKITTLKNVTSIYCGENNCSAISADTTIWHWGDSSKTEFSSLIPIKVEITPQSIFAVPEDHLGFGCDQLLNHKGTAATQIQQLVVSNMIPAAATGLTVTGKVSPVPYNDYGYGQSFLDEYAVEVTLTTVNALQSSTLKTIAIPNGNSDIGIFTFRNVPAGEYALSFFKPGHLRRTHIVHINETTTTLKPKSGQVFDLWWGDTSYNGYIDEWDVSLLWYGFNQTWGGGYGSFAYGDLSGDGYVDELDIDMCYDYLYCSETSYPDSIGYPVACNGVPKDVKTTLVTDDSISLEWAPVSDATYYVVLYGNGLTLTTYTSSITFDKLTPESSYHFQVMAGNSKATSDYSKELTVKTSAIQTHTIVLSGKNINLFAGKIFKVTYDPTKLTLVDFAAQTQALDTATGAIPETDIEILSGANGVITFKIVNKTVPAGKTWSGVLTAVKFKATTTGDIVVKFEQ